MIGITSIVACGWSESTPVAVPERDRGRAIAFGYLVSYTGSYTAPFIPMIALLFVGAVLWLRLDPSHDIFEQEAATVVTSAAVEPAV